jgi:DNA-directed RNA polymerase specialized sigma24 family protein
MEDTKERMSGWNQLEHSEQEALLLVDVLQKSYQNVAIILNNSESDVARVVARGRYKLIRNSDSVPE